jgi:hypothetical protein
LIRAAQKNIDGKRFDGHYADAEVIYLQTRLADLYAVRTGKITATP